MTYHFALGFLILLVIIASGDAVVALPLAIPVMMREPETLIGNIGVKL